MASLAPCATDRHAVTTPLLGNPAAPANAPAIAVRIVSTHAHRGEPPVLESLHPHHTGGLDVTWLKDNASAIGAMAGVLVAFVAVLQLVVVGPMNARFDAVDQRLDRLETEVSGLRTLGERISHNTGRIDLLTEQLQAIPTPGR